jgi:hypothetical protein
MASRNGLNPQIKGPKGVGYGRALPSAFGFGNGISLTGASGINADAYLKVPTLIGQSIPTQWTIEFWVLPSSEFFSAFEGWIEWYDNHPPSDGSTALARLQGQPGGNSYQILGNTSAVQFGTTCPSNLIPNVKNHIVITMDFQNKILQFIMNGDTALKSITGIQVFNYPYTATFELFNIFGLVEYNLYASQKVDEFRMYKEILSDGDIVTNFNNGTGNNPLRTDNLFVWYQFEKFEMLDFSSLQDGSDIQFGIRDMSGKNNHGLPINMNTNLETANYILQPFSE